jgi:hypothetical protein
MDVIRLLSRVPRARRWVLPLFERGRQLRAAELVAHELEFNAEVARAIAGGQAASLAGQQLASSRWRECAETLRVVSATHPDLWDRLVETYARIERTRAFGTAPPEAPSSRI